MRNIFNLLLAFIISLTAGLTITAQVSYSKIGDNPNFSDLAIRPNIGAIVGMGFGATYGIDAEYRKPNLPVQLRIVYDRSFFGDQNMSTRPNAMPLQRMDVGVGYPIIKKTKTKNVQVILSSRMVSSSSSSETYNIKYVDVEGIVESKPSALPVKIFIPILPKFAILGKKLA